MNISNQLPDIAPDPVSQFVSALSANDPERLATLLAPDVWFRALLPGGLRELHEASEVIAQFGRWFGPPRTASFEKTDRHRVGSREYFRLSVTVEIDGQLYNVEQVGYCRVRDGKISRLDLVCTGFHPVD